MNFTRNIGLLALAWSLPAVAPALAQDVRIIHEGWSDDVAKAFWIQDQGSEMMPWSWFVNLEKADGTGPFTDRLEFFGFIPNPAGGLPIGIAKHTDKSGIDWAGPTCAACHVGLWQYNGKRILVDGAPGMVDFDAFFSALTDALSATVNDPAKLQRLTAKTGASADQIRAQLARFEARRRMNNTSLRGGYGRVDAFGQIFNQVAVALVGNPPEAAREPNAPVSYPCLWDIAQHKFVQWNGSAPNLGVKGDGSMLRNIGEVIGVFGEVDSTNIGFLPRFPSSVNLDGIKKVEDWVSNLVSPAWPSDILGEIGDVSKGRKIYADAKRGCIGCHAVLSPKTNRPYPIPITMTPVAQVQTDSTMLDNFGRTAPSLRLEKHLLLTNPRDPLETFGPTAPVVMFTQYFATGALSDLESKDPLALSKSILDSLKALEAGQSPPRSYKARPLNGIWATAPYLHNGSVPNLQDLLTDPPQRVTSFCVGDHSFDPVAVGVPAAAKSAATCRDGSSRFDATLTGNRNTGHPYGTTLSADEKRALIAYLKSL
jgi:hypothetical protein